MKSRRVYSNHLHCINALYTQYSYLISKLFGRWRHKACWVQGDAVKISRYRNECQVCLQIWHSLCGYNDLACRSCAMHGLSQWNSLANVLRARTKEECHGLGRTAISARWGGNSCIYAIQRNVLKNQDITWCFIPAWANSLWTDFQNIHWLVFSATESMRLSCHESILLVLQSMSHKLKYLRSCWY